MAGRGSECSRPTEINAAEGRGRFLDPVVGVHPVATQELVKTGAAMKTPLFFLDQTLGCAHRGVS